MRHLLAPLPRIRISNPLLRTCRLPPARDSMGQCHSMRTPHTVGARPTLRGRSMVLTSRGSRKLLCPSLRLSDPRERTSSMPSVVLLPSQRFEAQWGCASRARSSSTTIRMGRRLPTPLPSRPWSSRMACSSWPPSPSMGLDVSSSGHGACLECLASSRL